MTKQEKKLLSLLGVLVVVVISLVGINKYFKDRQEFIAKRDRLKGEAERAERSHELHAQLAEEKEWLDSVASKSQEYSKELSEFQSFVSNSPKSLGFSIYNSKVDRLSGEGGTFRRVQMEVQAKASQPQLLQWLLKLHKPAELRAVTSLKVFPDKKNEETLICQVVVEKFIVEGESNVE